MRVLLVRERVAPRVAENCYAVLLSPRDDPFGEHTRRFTWPSATACQQGWHYDTWQAARAAAKEYARALAEQLGAELVVE